ncbi:MAG: IS3 family transposase [Bdellovibrionota bacterium]
MRCGLVVELSGGILSINQLRKLLKVSKSSYYHWNAQANKRKLDAKAESELSIQIKLVFTESRQTYGVPRVWRKLLRMGVPCSKRQVSQIMRKNKLISVYNRKKNRFVVTTDSLKTRVPAPNLLKRDFKASAVNEKWVGDVTYILTDEGWLYLAVVLDLFSRKAIGYALGVRNNAELACKAFQMAITRRQQPKYLIYHSDRGSVYDSDDFKALLAKNKITPSMSRKGDCWDNAVAESFFQSLKIEEVHRKKYNLKISALAGITDWVENFYNSERMHSTIDYCTPNEFELVHQHKFT